MRVAVNLGKNDGGRLASPKHSSPGLPVIHNFDGIDNKEHSMKSASSVFLVVMMFCSLGLWGCTHQKNGAYHSKIRDLESRHLKLEEDYKTMVQIGDQLRKKVGNLENQRTELARQVDELKVV